MNRHTHDYRIPALPVPAFRHMPSAAAFALVLAACAAFGTTATEAPLPRWMDVPIFSGADPETPWRGSDGAAIRPRRLRDRPGLALDIAFPAQSDRVFLDRDCRLNLEPFTVFTLDIRVSDPEALSRGTLYFKSGNGWYGGWFPVGASAQWQTVTLSRRAFAIEGQPAGWNRIEGIRLAFGKAAERSFRVDVASLQTRSSPLAVLANQSAREDAPDEWPAVQRAVDRLLDGLSGHGLYPAVISDTTLSSNGIPPDCRLMVLPYNPTLPENALAALEAFCAGGGRLIVIYGLPPELAPLLGLRGKHWRPADPPDAFHAIAFGENPPIAGVPPLLLQHSWNANIPEPETAAVLATWQNPAGGDSGLPAVTLSGNGVFIGHILTNVDRDRKLRMVMALAAHLQPSLVPLLVEQIQRRSERLFDLENWEQTRSMIEKTAERSGRERDTARALRRMDALRKRFLATDPPQGFAEALDGAAEIQRLVRAAYTAAVPSVPEARERRALWSHRAEGLPGQPWARTARELRQAGFNTLFANHQWAGMAYYPSDVLPVSPRVSEEGDLLRSCLDACQDAGIRLHLWSVLWVLEHAPEDWVSGMRDAGRLMQDRNGKTVNWLCPADPRNVDLAAHAAVEVIERYALDGLHLDYIRYPDANACFCANCAARFRNATGRKAADWPADVISGPDQEAFRSWRRDQITAALVRIRMAVKAVRPETEVSAAVWPGWPGVRDSIGQDWVAWCREGLLDAVYPMNYVTTADEAVRRFTRQRDALPAGFPIYPGLAPTTHNLPPEETVRQVDALRRAGAGGFALFELDPDLREIHLPALRAGATSP